MSKDFTVYASLLAERPEDVAVIASWLAERARAEAASLQEAAEDTSSFIQDNVRLAEASGGYDVGIASGQIRILSKRFTSDPDVVPFVAVLEEWEEGMWLVAPFSQYSTPATPGEMATGEDSFGLEVLQVWNSRTVQTTLLERSFLFGEIPAETVAEASALFRHELGGTDLPSGFKSRRGAPIAIKDDPRRDYLAESIARLAPLSNAVLKLAERSGKETKRLFLDADFLRLSIREKIPQRLAAATEKDSTFMLLLEGETEEDIRKTCVECRLLNDFLDLYPGDDPYRLIFKAESELPSISADAPVSILARNRETLEIVGKGVLNGDTSEIIVTTIPDIKDPIETPDQMVLVLARD